MDLMIIINLLIAGIFLGALYALMSTGLTLIWGTVGILNFAHGAIITLGGYMVWVGLQYVGLNYVLSLVIVIMFSLFLGFILELFIFRPFRGKTGEFMNTIYCSLAFAESMAGIILIVFGPRYKKLPYISTGVIKVSNIIIMTTHELVLVILSISILISFWIFLKKHKYGLAMRAISQDRFAAQLMGINLNKVYLLTVGVGCLFAGVSGAFLGTVYFLSPHLGDMPLVFAFVIIVFGGLGSIQGTIAAAFILGLFQSTVGYLLGLGWSAAIFFLFMMLTILFRPSGLFGEAA